jgi:hypothetical protein
MKGTFHNNKLIEGSYYDINGDLYWLSIFYILFIINFSW